MNSAKRCFALGFSGLARGNLPGKIAADGGEHGLQGVSGDIMNVNIVFRHGANMGDPAAHLSCANDADTLDLVAHLSRLTDFRMLPGAYV